MRKFALGVVVLVACGHSRPAATPAAAAPAEQEQPDTACCCEATMVNEDNQEETTHGMMGATACTRKTEDGKCVDASMCATAE